MPRRELARGSHRGASSLALIGQIEAEGRQA